MRVHSDAANRNRIYFSNAANYESTNVIANCDGQRVNYLAIYPPKMLGRCDDCLNFIKTDGVAITVMTNRVNLDDSTWLPIRAIDNITLGQVTKTPHSIRSRNNSFK